VSNRIVVGNSLASFVAARKLLDSGIKFDWFADSNHLKGVWGGFEFEGEFIDIGMVNFELDLSPHIDECLIDNYDPFLVNSCANFLDGVKEWLSSIDTLTTLPPIKVISGGKLYEDFLISNSFVGLRNFIVDRNLIFKRTETPSIFHPSNKYFVDKSEVPNIPSLHNYCEEYYGEEFVRDFLVNWENKIAPGASKVLPYTRHRSIWFPLFYPETLSEIRGNSELESFPPQNFNYPTRTNISTFFRDFATGVLDDFELEIRPVSDLDIKSLSQSKVIWGEDMNSFKNLFDNLKTRAVERDNSFRSYIDIRYFHVPIDATSIEYVLLNLDPEDHTWYRITKHGVFSGALIFSIESLHDDNFHPEEFWSKISLIMNCRIDKIIKEMVKVPLFRIHSQVELIDLRKEINFLRKKHQNIVFVGPSLVPFGQTMNDQIIQGLAAGRE